MAIRFKTLWLALVCYSFSLPAMADNFSSPHNSYISLNAGRSKSVNTCASPFSTGANCSENGKVYRIAYGYHFTPTWGMEVSYGDFGNAEERGVIPTPAGVPGSGLIPYVWTWEAVGWELAATGTLHFGDSISLIGKVGYVRASAGQEIIVTTSTNELWHAVAHEANNSTSAGIGVQYDFNRSYALHVKYEYFGKLGDLSKVKTSATAACLVLKF